MVEIEKRALTRMDDCIAVLLNAARANDPPALDTAATAFIDALPRQGDPIGQEVAVGLLNALRRDRSFGIICRLAPAILIDGCDHPAVHRLYAQALVETGAEHAAIALLDGLLARDDVHAGERADALGIRGRAWKEIALRRRGVRDALAIPAIRESYGSYASAHDADPDNLYAGINRVALSAWDRGLALDPDERARAAGLATDILSRAEAAAARSPPPWDLATAGEACLALGRQEEAVTWYAAYVAHEDVGAFELGGTLRQLRTIWKMDDGGHGAELLGPMTSRLLQLSGGSATLTPHQIAEYRSIPKDGFERVLGKRGPRSFRWIRKGFDAAKSVASISTGGERIGTGFLVRGGDLDPRLGDEPCVLTNAHVVSERRQAKAIHPSAATIRFELSDVAMVRNDGIEVKAIVWESFIYRHDAALLSLAMPLPASMKPLKLSDRLPARDADPRSRVLIIGHPSGREISFSFEDNELLDYDEAPVADLASADPCRVHYRTPTERGSSGSPVFDENWHLIALHHSGSKEKARLNGDPGVYAANEGIWIQSIRRAMAKADLTKTNPKP